MSAAPLRLTWLGQAGFLLELAGLRVLIDPFFSPYESRRYPAELMTSDLGQVDWLLATHEHLDHFDVDWIPELLAASPDLRAVVPSAMRELAEGILGSERLTLVDAGDMVDLGSGSTLEAIPACHAIAVDDGYSHAIAETGTCFVGYLLHGAGHSVYHSGDTLVTDAVLAALARREIDIALLPINGRSFFREESGLVGNMNAREAVGLAHRLGCRVVVPMHWDMFEGNTERPGSFVDEIDDLEARFHTLVPTRFVPIAVG